MQHISSLLPSPVQAVESFTAKRGPDRQTPSAFLLCQPVHVPKSDVASYTCTVPVEANSASFPFPCQLLFFHLAQLSP